MRDAIPERIALYGGSFNPPHVGHLLVVSYVLATQNVAQVWLMPCFRHAFSKPLADYEHRVAMCNELLSVLDPARVGTTRIEETLGGVSRTIDTVRALTSAHPNRAFDIVVGTDIFAERHAWKNFDELERQCRFIVIGRDGYPAPDGHVTSPPLMTVSSTEIRELASSGAPIDSLVSRNVATYIERHNLYR